MTFKSLDRSIAWFFISVFAAALYVRLYWGIDLSDESQQVYNAYGPVIGARPFVDEWTITQTGSLLFTPLAYLYTKLVPSLDGLMLFFRHLYFLMALGTTIFLYRFWKAHLPPVASAMIAVAPLMMIPLGLPNVSYNSLVYFAGLIGIHMVFRAKYQDSLALCRGAGLVHGFATYAHPAYLPIGGLLFIQIWIKAGMRHALSYAGFAGALLTLLFGGIIALFGWDNLVRSFTFQSSANTLGGFGKIGFMWSETLQFWHHPWWVVAWAVAWVALGLTGRMNWALALGSFALTQGFLIAEDFVYGLHLRVAYYGLAIVFLILVDRAAYKDVDQRRFLLWIWWPSFLAGGTLAYVSSNSLTVASFAWIGCLFYAFYRILRPQPEIKRWVAIAHHLVVLGILAQMLVFTMTHFYRDDPVAKLTERIDSGAFAGIYTTPFRASILRELSKDLQSLRNKDGTIFIYDLFPAGYFYTPLRPVGPITLPMFPAWFPKQREIMVEHFRKSENLPDFVVEFHYFAPRSTEIIPVNRPNEDLYKDPFKDFFLKTGQYESFRQNDFYRILKRASARVQ